MLKGIDPLLTPELLWVLAAMGHGDDLALVDSNHPAERVARATASGRLVRMPGIALPRNAEAILSLLPLDQADDAARRMTATGHPGEWTDVQREVQAAVDRARGRAAPMPGIERFAFYEAAKSGFAIVQAGDNRPYGCFLLRCGVVRT
jgi:L-fucose mutarotase